MSIPLSLSQRGGKGNEKNERREARSPRAVVWIVVCGGD